MMKKLKLFISLVIIFTAIIFYADLFLSEKQEQTDFDTNVEKIKKVSSPISEERLNKAREKMRERLAQIREEEKNTPNLDSANQNNNQEDIKNTKNNSENIKKTEEKVEKTEQKSHNFEINYILEDYENTLSNLRKFSLESILISHLFNNKVNNLITDLIEAKEEVRWKMKNWAILMFAPHLLKNEEFISVFIHELGHFVDLYYLRKWYFWDASNKFYDISWKSTKILKSWNGQKDFVSGYAMTNKYEDFAESFEFFILHNKDFLKKAQNSSKLMKKYEFFEEHIFVSGEFKNSNFWENEFKEDIWDTTKLEISEKKFLNYIKNN